MNHSAALDLHGLRGETPRVEYLGTNAYGDARAFAE